MTPFLVFFVFMAGTFSCMRSAVFAIATTPDPDERLSTGEAAKLLNSSRQHVVDLCNKGLLPFTTTGTHRRVRRGDVEAVRSRTERLTPDQQRSLWLAYAVAGRIVLDPEHAYELAEANLDKMRQVARGTAREWLDEWERLLDGPLDALLATYTSRSLLGRELRQNAPFAGLLGDEERLDVIRQWRQRNRTRDRGTPP